jgi:hypothetical protein
LKSALWGAELFHKRIAFWFYLKKWRNFRLPFLEVFKAAGNEKRRNAASDAPL